MQRIFVSLGAYKKLNTNLFTRNIGVCFIEDASVSFIATILINQTVVGEVPLDPNQQLRCTFHRFYEHLIEHPLSTTLPCIQLTLEIFSVVQQNN